MKKMYKIFVPLIVPAAAAAAFAAYWHHNLHWYDKYEKNLKETGAVEKQYTLPGGSIINYGEIENDNPPLLLIHGQMSIWQDYAPVVPELSKNWHIYSIDVSRRIKAAAASGLKTGAGQADKPAVLSDQHPAIK